MRTQKRFRKAAVLAAILSAATFGSQALAQTSSTTSDVSVAVVNGLRSLNVTGTSPVSGLPVPGTGPAALALGPTATQAPFGVVVSDLQYSRVGYDVAATLSDLYKVDPAAAGGYDCATKLESSQFAVNYANLLANSGAKALVDPVLTFTGTVPINLSLLTGLLSGTPTVPVQGVVQDVTTSLSMMGVTNGVGGAFTNQGAHPVCGLAATTPTSVPLQAGTPQNPDLTGLASQLLDLANGSDTVLTLTEAVTAGLLPPEADDIGGPVWTSLRSTLQALDLASPLATILNLNGLTDSVFATLSTTAAPVLNLVGQTGVYQNVPNLVLTPNSATPAGVYRGSMLVTLTDRP